MKSKKISPAFQCSSCSCCCHRKYTSGQGFTLLGILSLSHVSWVNLAFPHPSRSAQELRRGGGAKHGKYLSRKKFAKNCRNFWTGKEKPRTLQCVAEVQIAVKWEKRQRQADTPECSRYYHFTWLGMVGFPWGLWVQLGRALRQPCG